MERRAAEGKGRQVKCLIASEGHMWMEDYFDHLPAAVRRRLANSHHNICAACMSEDAEEVAQARGLERPSVGIYLEVIASIESQLDRDQ